MLLSVIITREIASRCSVSSDGTWLKRDIQSIMIDTNISLWAGGLSVYGSNFVLTLSKQNVCLMKDTNGTRHSTSEFRCKLYPPERKLTHQRSLNLEGGAQSKI